MELHLGATTGQSTELAVESLKAVIKAERVEIFKFGMASIVIAALFALASTTDPFTVSTLITLIVGAWLALRVGQSWYKLVGLIFDLEEMMASLERRIFLSSCPTLTEVVRRPRTFAEYAWPAFILLPQILILVLAMAALTSSLASGDPLIANPKTLATVVFPVILVLSGAIAGGLYRFDAKP